MGDAEIYPVPQWWKENGRVDAAARRMLYDLSLIHISQGIVR